MSIEDQINAGIEAVLRGDLNPETGLPLTLDDVRRMTLEGVTGKTPTPPPTPAAPTFVDPRRAIAAKLEQEREQRAIDARLARVLLDEQGHDIAGLSDQDVIALAFPEVTEAQIAAERFARAERERALEENRQAAEASDRASSERAIRQHGHDPLIENRMEYGHRVADERRQRGGQSARIREEKRELGLP